MKFKYLLLALAACQVPAVQSPRTPDPADVIANATFRVDIETLSGTGEWEAAGSGTAWVAVNNSESHLITAGHVCHHDPLVLTRFTLVDRQGKQFTAEIENQSAYDLCLLSASHVGPALTVAPFDPVYDEPLVSVGAPLGVYGCFGGSTHDECGMAPITRGWYAGGNLVSMPMAGGNSGSAVLSASGVIGVLVEGYRGFDSLSFVEPRMHLLKFLADSGY